MQSPFRSRGRADRGARAAELPPTPGPISSLREHPRRAGRYLLEVGGVAVGPVSVEAIAELGLREGTELDEALLARATAASRRVACYDQALDALARRARSARDLERWLLLREQAPGDVADALERLTSLGLLDDLAFARAFAETRSRAQGFGARRVAVELARKGVARGVVDQVIGELRESAPDGAEGALEAAAAKRALTLRNLDPAVARRRLTAWLVRRGFGVREASEAARRALGASGTTD